jgi:hypothetical protein
MKKIMIALFLILFSSCEKKDNLVVVNFSVVGGKAINCYILGTCSLDTTNVVQIDFLDVSHTSGSIKVPIAADMILKLQPAGGFKNSGIGKKDGKLDCLFMEKECAIMDIIENISYEILLDHK